MKNSFVFILIIIFNISLYSQSNENSTNSKISINLEQALDLAVENDKTLKQAEYDVRIAKTQKDASFSDLFLPSLTVSGGLNISEPQEYQYSNINTGIYSSADTWNAQATLSKTLFTGFRNWNTDKAREINLKMMKETYFDERKNVAINTQLNFYNTFVAQENYKVYYQQQLNYSNRMRESYIKYRNGQVSML